MHDDLYALRERFVWWRRNEELAEPMDWHLEQLIDAIDAVLEAMLDGRDGDADGLSPVKRLRVSLNALFLQGDDAVLPEGPMAQLKAWLKKVENG